MPVKSFEEAGLGVSQCGEWEPPGADLAAQELGRVEPAELILAQEQERRRIAALLHDSVGQTLALAKMQLGAIAKTPIDGETADRVAAVEALIGQAIDCTRSLTAEIFPPVLYEFGFAAALRWLAVRAGEQCGIDIEVDAREHPIPLPPAMRLVLFEAARELLCNVAKHAGASACTLSFICQDNAARLVVQDDGRGFATANPQDNSQNSGGFGLFNMRQRMQSLGGRLIIASKPGAGARVALTLPLQTRFSKTKRNPT